MLEKKLIEYEKRFDDNFPVMCFMGVPDSELERLVDKCLLEDKPYKAEISDNLCY